MPVIGSSFLLMFIYKFSYPAFMLSLLREELLHGIAQMIGGEFPPIADLHEAFQFFFIVGYIVKVYQYIRYLFSFPVRPCVLPVEFFTESRG